MSDGNLSVCFPCWTNTGKQFANLSSDLSDLNNLQRTLFVRFLEFLVLGMSLGGQTSTSASKSKLKAHPILRISKRHAIGDVTDTAMYPHYFPRMYFGIKGNLMTFVHESSIIPILQ